MYKQRDIESLWNKYEGLLKKLESEGIDKLLEEHGQRLLESSYSLKESEPFCGIGGNIEYALKLTKTAMSISKLMNYDLNNLDIMKCALLSVLGRIGTDHCNRLNESKSEWHIEKLGQYYEWNENCPKYNTNHMTLYFLQRYNVYLTWDQMQSILLYNTENSEDNKFYNIHKSRMTIVLQTAHDLTIKDEIDQIKESYTVPF